MAVVGVGEGEGLVMIDYTGKTVQAKCSFTAAA